MTEDVTETNRGGLRERIRWHTRILDSIYASPHESTNGVAAWAKTTSAVLAFLIALQFITGALIAFYYVPSIDSAHTTVAYIEKEVGGGSLIRALHYHGSQWIPVVLLLHLAQLFWRGAHERRPFGWFLAILLLGLMLASGATGFSLSWDARAYFSTRVGANIAGGLPLLGDAARLWILGGQDISALTLSRLYALHLLIFPFLILSVIILPLLILRENFRSSDGDNFSDGSRFHTFHLWATQLFRHAIMVLIVFASLFIISKSFPAPLGPEASQAEINYVPRPGPQFLWLFQLLKYFRPSLASIVALFVPTFFLTSLALLPFLRFQGFGRLVNRYRRAFGHFIFASIVLTVGGLSFLALNDDARTREQLARQARDEKEWRSAPFVPRMTGATLSSDNPVSSTANSSPTPITSTVSNRPAPPVYAPNCAKCHGANGEGKSINPPLIGIGSRPNRSVEDIVRIIDNPRSYNLEKRMPSFAGKLSADEKLAIAEWVVSLGR